MTALSEDLPQRSQWDVIARWLTEHPEARGTLSAAEFPDRPADDAINQLTILSAQPGAPPVLVAAVQAVQPVQPVKPGQRQKTIRRHF